MAMQSSQPHHSVILTATKAFGESNEVLPNATRFSPWSTDGCIDPSRLSPQTVTA